MVLVGSVPTEAQIVDALPRPSRENSWPRGIHGRHVSVRVGIADGHDVSRRRNGRVPEPPLVETRGVGRKRPSQHVILHHADGQIVRGVQEEPDARFAQQHAHDDRSTQHGHVDGCPCQLHSGTRILKRCRAAIATVRILSISFV